MSEANRAIDNHATTAAPVTSEQLSAALVKPPRTLLGDAWRRFRKHKPALIGVAILVLFTLMVTIGVPFYVRYRVSLAEQGGMPLSAREQTLTGVMNQLDYLSINAPPSLTHPFGTDELGRDLFARALYGGRISLSVGFVAMLIAVSLGAVIGSTAGFFGGIVDQILMRLTDLFLSLPTIPLILLIVYLFRDPVTRAFGLETGIFVIVVSVIGGLAWMSTARIVRATFLSLKQKEFVEAAVALGVSRKSIMFRHILPNAFSPIIVAATLEVGTAIISESTLSFLGVGFPPDIPTWGRLVTDGSQFLQIAPWLALFPGALIFLTVLSINFLGDGLRDALDPRSRL